MFAYQLFESFFFVNSLKTVLQDKTISNQIHVRLRMSRNQFVCVIKPDFCVLDTCTKFISKLENIIKYELIPVFKALTALHTSLVH